MDELANSALVVDWYSLIASTLWVLGLAALLATFSLAHWLAGQHRRSFRKSLSDPLFRLVTAASTALFTLGLMLTVESWWYKIIWAGLVAVSLSEGIAVWRKWYNILKRS